MGFIQIYDTGTSLAAVAYASTATRSMHLGTHVRNPAKLVLKKPGTCDVADKDEYDVERTSTSTSTMVRICHGDSER